jgi:hypothetical protein
MCVAEFTERSDHTAYFEANLAPAGYILVNMPIDQWRLLDSPQQITITCEAGDLLKARLQLAEVSS